jgi:UDP-N-acetylglucosamine 2-epimerase (non-hydrolysing)
MAGPILTIVGARPNFMKAAPIHRAYEQAGVPHELIHTGQHYDDAMSKVFFDDLGMPKPSVYLGVGSASHAVQTATVMIGLEKVFLEKKPRMVLVVGDVNSTMAAALVASKLLIPVAHVEAGLRSRDWTMPEEVNRVVTDSISDLLLTPSPDADENLLAEGKPKERIRCVGNVMIDTLFMHLPRAKALDVPGQMGLVPGQYGILTLHRPSNVDDAPTFERIISALLHVQERTPLVFPVHPRTRARLSPSTSGASWKRRPTSSSSSPSGTWSSCLWCRAPGFASPTPGASKKRPPPWASRASRSARTPNARSPWKKAPTPWSAPMPDEFVKKLTGS